MRYPAYGALLFCTDFEEQKNQGVYLCKSNKGSNEICSHTAELSGSKPAAFQPDNIQRYGELCQYHTTSRFCPWIYEKNRDILKGISKNLLHGSFSMTRETLIKTKSPRSNGHTHGADFDTLRFNQRIPCIICVVVKP